MMKLFWVGIGGAAGSITRVVLVAALPDKWFNIPVNILIVNIIGCLIAGLCASILSVKTSLTNPGNDLVISGFLGGFTTFSAFALDVGRLYEKELYVETTLYISASLILSLSAFFIGLKLAKGMLS